MAAVSRINGWRTFLAVWAGQLLSLLGSALTSFALSVWIYQRTQSETQFALNILFLALPRVVFGPFGGALADRWDRRIAMIVGDAGSAASTLALAVLLFTGRLEVWHIYIATAISSAFSTLQRPAYSAAVSLLIPTHQLGRANGLRRIASSAAEMLGPVLAGYLVVAVGIERVLLIDLLTFVFAVATLACVRFPVAMRPNEAPEETPESAPSLWREALDGWRYIITRPGLRGLMLMYSATMFLGGTTEVLLTPYILATNTPNALGWVMSACGAGLALGALLLVIWGGSKRRLLAILGFEMMVSVCTVAAGFPLPVAGLALVMLVYFVAIALSDGHSESLWQSKVAHAFQGRVFAARDVVAIAALPLGLAVAAPLAEFVLEPAFRQGGALAATAGVLLGSGAGRGIGALFVLAGLFNLTVVTVAWRYAPIRNLDRDIPDVDV